MNNEIVRGNDELAYWIRGMAPEFRHNGIIAYYLKDALCPMSTRFNCNYNLKNEQRDYSYKNLYEHLVREHNVFAETDEYKKSLGILQLLVKYEVNNGRRIKARLKKRAEAVYMLGKEFGLSADMLKGILHKNVSEIMKIAYTGLILCNNDQTLPQWIKHIIQQEDERKNK